ncbi:transposase domain-containing protein [Streptomyces minutiscleroticus]|uniref:transposase domain-containing protein n=1 Tax=Streptomyces minutiscleroticus TaxID=68238 RepID=UPI003D9E475A
MAAGKFAPGHLGELTAVVPFELIDAVLEETRSVQRRLRDLPSRVGSTSSSPCASSRRSATSWSGTS